jgi:hypothetical protein
MARTTKTSAPVERQTVPIRYRIIPYFAVEVDDRNLSGTRGIGETPFQAIVSMRGAVRRRYPYAHYDLDESIVNPEFIAGWTMPEPF